MTEANVWRGIVRFTIGAIALWNVNLAESTTGATVRLGYSGSSVFRSLIRPAGTVVSDAASEDSRGRFRRYASMRAPTIEGSLHTKDSVTRPPKCRSI